MPKLERILQPPTEPLSAKVARQIIDYLFSGELTVGERLPSERSLAESLGVNRPAVREALRTLQFLGLIEVRQTSGTYFRGADTDLLFRLFEWSTVFSQPHASHLLDARAELEVVVAGRAAARACAADLEALHRCLLTMRTGDPEAFIEADVQFHALLAEMSDNIVIRDMLRSCRSLVREWVDRSVRGSRSTTEAYLDHVAVYDAVKRGDQDGARTAMQQHMKGARVRLLRAAPDLQDFTEADRSAPA